MFEKFRNAWNGYVNFQYLEDILQRAAAYGDPKWSFEFNKENRPNLRFKPLEVAEDGEKEKPD